MALCTYFVFLICLVSLVCDKGIHGKKYDYEPNWESLDKRPTPSWYDESKFGIFIHWGVFSVPSFGSEWFWEYWKGQKVPKWVNFMEKNYKPDFTYADFASQFTAEFFEPDQWAEIIENSGAKYVVLTSKHHEGFTNWPSNHSWNWNSMDVGPKRDLVGDLAKAIRNKTDVHFGLYHSLFEWFNPLYLTDKANGYNTQDFVRTKTMPELYELVTNYEPEVIWSDGCMGPDTYFNSTHFLAWLFNESPVRDTVATNDRWGFNTSCRHGGYYTCHDRYNPGHVLKHKWENCLTLDTHSWGFRREMMYADVLTIEQVLYQLASTVSCGGNMLLNIGPTREGTIAPIFQERLSQIGSWLKVNGEAIYSTRPWIYQNDTITPGVWYTSKKSTSGVTDVYAIVLDWPTGDELRLGVPESGHSTSIHMLGYPHEFGFKAGLISGIVIEIPPIPVNAMPCEWAWVFKLEGLVNGEMGWTGSERAEESERVKGSAKAHESDGYLSFVSGIGEN